MKIAYTSYWNSQNVQSWSGIVFFMAKALSEQGIEIEYIDNLHSFKHDIFKVKSLFYKRILAKNYRRFRELRIVKDIAKKISHKLKHSDASIVLSPGSLEIALLETNKPIVFWSDATFAGLLDFYPEYINLDKKTIAHGNFLEQSAFDRASLIIFSSDWAAQTAIDNYNIDIDKIKVIPFGANIIEEVNTDIIKKYIKMRFENKIKLLFIGVNWQKKGGDYIYQATKELKKRGLDVQLDIVGCEPEINETLPDYIISHGFLNKNNPEDWKKFKNLFLNAFFFVLPTQAEAYGLVFCEANSFGIPTIGSNIGGVSTIIKNNVNGFLINPKNAKNEIVDIVLKYSMNKTEYENLALQSYAEYKERLNWQVAGKKLKSLLTNNFYNK